MTQRITIAKPAAVDDIAARAGATAEDLAATGATVAAKAESIAVSAKEAIAEMRRILEDFAAATGEKASEAERAVESTAAATAERVGALVEDARVLGRDGLDGVADTVAKRPFASLAIAAGVGLALGLLTRPGSER